MNCEYSETRGRIFLEPKQKTKKENVSKCASGEDRSPDPTHVKPIMAL